MEADGLKTANAKDRQPVVVLQAPELPLDPVKVPANLALLLPRLARTTQAGRIAMTARMLIAGIWVVVWAATRH